MVGLFSKSQELITDVDYTCNSLKRILRIFRLRFIIDLLKGLGSKNRLI